MTGITDARKLGATFEALNSVGNTSQAKEFYEEALPLLPDVRSSEIYADPVPPVPPALEFGEDNGIVKRVRMALTLDNSVPNKQTWVAVDQWTADWSSGSFDVSSIMNRWLSKKDGLGYLPKIFGGINGDTEIPPLDPSAPIFYPRAGILNFGDSNSLAAVNVLTAEAMHLGEEVTAGQVTQVSDGMHSESELYEQDFYSQADAGTEAASSIWIEGYIYVGRMQSDIAGGTGETPDYDADFVLVYNQAKQTGPE